MTYIWGYYHKISINETRLKITFLELYPDLPGANELALGSIYVRDGHHDINSPLNYWVLHQIKHSDRHFYSIGILASGQSIKYNIQNNPHIMFNFYVILHKFCISCHESYLTHGNIHDSTQYIFTIYHTEVYMIFHNIFLLYISRNYPWHLTIYYHHPPHGNIYDFWSHIFAI